MSLKWMIYLAILGVVAWQLYLFLDHFFQSYPRPTL